MSCVAVATLVYTDSYEGGTLEDYSPELKVGDKYTESAFTPEGTITKVTHFCTAIERARCELNGQFCPFF